MWGNTRGWMLSAIIVLLTAGGLWFLSIQNDTSPSNWDDATQAKYLAKVQLAPDPRSLVPVMTKPCDAGDTYRAAIAAYKANQKMLDALKSDDTSDQEAFDDILKGAECSNMTLLAKDPEEYIGYNNKFTIPLDALKGVANDMSKRALGFYNHDKMDDAKKYYEALFSLGVKLWDERLVWDELDLAHTIISYGANGLGRIAIKANDNDRIQALKNFESARSLYVKNTLFPLEQVTHHLETEFPGNVFLLAKSSQDRLWRVEAMRQMGRIRFNVSDKESASAADQRAATRMLARWAKDAALDPIVRTAAQKAHDVTADELQQEVSGVQE